MKVSFVPLLWEDYPSINTPINAENLNRLEAGVAGLYEDMVEINAKLNGAFSEYVTDWLDEHVTPTGSAVIVDNTLSITGAAADAKKAGDEIADLKEEMTHIGGLSEDIKQAMLQIARKVIYIDSDSPTYYNALYNALYPPADLVSISAVYTQSGTVYDTAVLDSLKSDLTVTAIYSDSSTATVTNYTLSGTLTEGTSTITVTYGGKTDTFSVNVTHLPANLIYSWDLTESLVDSVAGISAVTTATQGSTGLVFDAKNQYCDFGAIYQSGRTYELDVLLVSTTSYTNMRRILMADVDADTAYSGGSGIVYGRNGTKWGVYGGSGWLSVTDNQMDGIGFFDGKTLRVYVDDDMIWHIYAKTIGTSDPFALVGTTPSAMRSYTNGHLYIGGSRDDSIAEATFTGLRVYEGEAE